jgi:hypothetical protein
MRAAASAIVRTGSDADDENAFSSFSRTYLPRLSSPGAIMAADRGAVYRGAALRNQH